MDSLCSQMPLKSRKGNKRHMHTGHLKNSDSGVMKLKGKIAVGKDGCV